MEVDGNIVFFYETEKVYDLETLEPDDLEVKFARWVKICITKNLLFLTNIRELKMPFMREYFLEYRGICVTDGYQVYHTLEKKRKS